MIVDAGYATGFGGLLCEGSRVEAPYTLSIANQFGVGRASCMCFRLRPVERPHNIRDVGET
jgi:hypothetical protein